MINKFLYPNGGSETYIFKSVQESVESIKSWKDLEGCVVYNEKHESIHKIKPPFCALSTMFFKPAIIVQNKLPFTHPYYSTQQQGCQ